MKSFFKTLRKLKLFELHQKSIIVNLIMSHDESLNE